MSNTFYLFLHLVGVILLVAFTFYAFAGPNAKTKKWVMSLGGIASLVVLVSGFRMLGGSFPGWVIIKLLAWLGISAFSGLAYRRPKLRTPLLLVTVVLVVLAIWAVMFKP